MFKIVYEKIIYHVVPSLENLVVENNSVTKLIKIL